MNIITILLLCMVFGNIIIQSQNKTNVMIKHGFNMYEQSIFKRFDSIIKYFITIDV